LRFTACAGATQQSSEDATARRPAHEEELELELELLLLGYFDAASARRGIGIGKGANQPATHAILSGKLLRCPLR
jgi:hypothetical protein